jgi:hypothetical protein
VLGWEKREISVKEACLLQGFNKQFNFHAQRDSLSLKQIGNSVPPLAAKILGEALLPAFKATFKVQDKAKSSTSKSAKILSNETRLKSRAM